MTIHPAFAEPTRIHRNKVVLISGVIKTTDVFHTLSRSVTAMEDEYYRYRSVTIFDRRQVNNRAAA
jgi:hypothetical protein